jgi:ABC-type Fe3+ transport system permease subunit
VSKRRTARVVFAVGFVILLADGAAAIWLGQISDRPLLSVVGVVLALAAAGLAFAYRRWMTALDAVDEARRDLHAEIGRLRDAVAAARAGRRPPPP